MSIKPGLLLSVALSLAPLACADLLGLEPGVLETTTLAGEGGQATSGGSAGRDASGSAGALASPGGATTGGASGSSGTTPEAGSAGTSGAAGAAGAAANAAAGAPSVGTCQDGTCSECPPDMKQAHSSDLYPFCIDAAEVTNEEYLAFTQRYTTSTVTASAACAGNASLVPDTACSKALTDVPSRKLPVVCVDYCDAEAYCATQGKRLCGRVGGTMNDPSDNADAAASEWYAACTGASGKIYPYGDVASDTKCNASGYSPADMGPRDVATLSECEGGFAGIYNLSGNVAEWEWSCSSSASNATCSTRGGSFLDGPYEVRCAGSISLGRHQAANNVGFRCCASLDN